MVAYDTVVDSVAAGRSVNMERERVSVNNAEGNIYANMVMLRADVVSAERAYVYMVILRPTAPNAADRELASTAESNSTVKTVGVMVYANMELENVDALLARVRRSAYMRNKGLVVSYATAVLYANIVRGEIYAENVKVLPYVLNVKSHIIIQNISLTVLDATSNYIRTKKELSCQE